MITQSGRTIYLAESATAARRAPTSAAVFTLPELEAMRPLPRSAAELIIDVKEVFTGAVVESVTKEEHQ